MFVNAIYLYDDKLVIFFNSGDKPVTIDDELLDKTEEGDGFVFGSPCSTIMNEQRKLLIFFYFAENPELSMPFKWVWKRKEKTCYS